MTTQDNARQGEQARRDDSMTLYLGSGLKQALEQKAQELDRSPSWMVRKAIVSAFGLVDREDE